MSDRYDWPQEWVDLIHYQVEKDCVKIPLEWGRDIEHRILSRLDEIGILRKPPKPREYNVCDICRTVDQCKEHRDAFHSGHPIVHVREVIGGA